MKFFILALAVAAEYIQPSYQDFLNLIELRNDGGWGHPIDKIAALFSLCPALETPTNGEHVCDQATCAIKCADGYIPTGKRRTKCRWNKSKGFFWKKTMGICETCETDLVAPAGITSTCGIKHGRKICTQTCTTVGNVFSLGEVQPETFSMRCKCPRDPVTKERTCGWFTRKLSGLVTQAEFDLLDCIDISTTTTSAPTTTAPTTTTTTTIAPITVVDCTLPDCATGTCGGEEISCSRTCDNGIFEVDAECPAEDEVKTEICPALACVADCTIPDCATGTCGGEEISCSRTCDNGVFGVDAGCPAEDEVKTETCPALACVVDCTLPDCATGTCGGDEISCSRTCDNGVFGVDAECPAEDEVKTETCPALACVDDCTLPVCATGTCGGEEISCSRICNNGLFGVDAECSAEDEVKTETCPALACVTDCDLPDCTSLCGGETIECTRVCENGVFGVDAECPAESEVKTDICPELCFQLTQNYLIQTFPKFYQTYKVSFELWPVTTSSSWANLLRVGVGADWSVYGDRNPVVFFSPDSTVLTIASALNGNMNHAYNTDPIPLETWTSVVIEQKKDENGDFRYSIEIAGTVIWEIINTQAEIFDDVKVHASDNFYAPPTVYMRSLEVTTEEGT